MVKFSWFGGWGDGFRPNNFSGQREILWNTFCINQLLPWFLPQGIGQIQQDQKRWSSFWLGFAEGTYNLLTYI